jgi:hypothetical protein
VALTRLRYHSRKLAAYLIPLAMGHTRRIIIRVLSIIPGKTIVRVPETGNEEHTVPEIATETVEAVTAVVAETETETAEADPVTEEAVAAVETTGDKGDLQPATAVSEEPHQEIHSWMISATHTGRLASGRFATWGPTSSPSVRTSMAPGLSNSDSRLLTMPTSNWYSKKYFHRLFL